MSAVGTGIFTVLNGDATLTALLGSHSLIGGSSRKSIFSKEPLPSGFKIDSHGPYIVISAPLSVNPGSCDTKNSNGLEDIRDIRCYGSIKMDSNAMDTIAFRVRTLFHRVSFAVTGYTVEIASVSGPAEADEDLAYGQVLSIRSVLKAT